MARMSIYVPDELKARMDDVDSVNWSSIAQAAFERELRLHPKLSEDEMQAAIERLRVSKIAQTDDVIAAGVKAGRKWAIESASYLDLSHVVDEIKNEIEYLDAIESEKRPSFPPLRNGQKLADFIPGGVMVDEYFEHGFCRGVLAVWDQVKDHLS